MGGCRSFSPPPFYVSTRRHICVRSIPPFFVYLSRFLFEVIRRTSKISLRICNLANIISFVIRPSPGSILAVEKNIDNNHLVFLIRGIWVDGAHSSRALYQPSLFYVSFEPRWPQMSLSSPNSCSSSQSRAEILSLMNSFWGVMLFILDIKSML
jgi:hypothetical protein